MALNFFNSIKEQTKTQLDEYINSYDQTIRYGTTETKPYYDNLKGSLLAASPPDSSVSYS